MLFNSSLATLATKSALPNNTTFGVFAFYQPGVIGGTPGTWNASTCSPDFMYNEDVLYNNNTYSYFPIKYWPNNPENTVSFWAYCPFSNTPDTPASSDIILLETGGVLNDYYTKTSKGIPDVFFTVTDGQKDLLLANIEESESSHIIKNLSKQSNSESVSFLFHHTLSLIDVNVKKVDLNPPQYTVKLKSVRFDGIYMTGVYRNGSSAWEVCNERQSFTLYSSETGDELYTTNRVLQSSMLIPQVLTDESTKLHVEYTIWRSGMLQTRTIVCDVALSSVFKDNLNNPIPRDINIHYSLNIKITPDDPIEFTVNWSNWGPDHNYHITS